MGISGLLPLLKSIHKHCTLKKFAGQTIGVDAYGWLHRGTVACAIELALDKPTTKYVDFAMGRVRMLLDFGVTPYLVFDGDNLPSKAGTNQERRKRREESKALGLEFYKAGKLAQAHQELQKAAIVTPYMARQLIEELKKLNVQYVVAPYEADAQLAFLETKGIINGILSEDSDLLVFGAKRLLTKLNQYGECVEIERGDFAMCKEISLTGWSDAMFRRMAILSGCDYLPNIEKMGLKTAYRYVRKYKDAEKTIRMIQFEGKLCVPAEYAVRFQQAELTFLHHRVFSPIDQKMVFLNELERGMKAEDMPYLGVYVDAETAIGVACGDLDPKTKEPIQTKKLSRPLLQETRRQTMATPADLKPKSSLESFFKAQRQPLAELDPNSLTPSSSQQRLLDRHRNASWQPRMVSSAPQLSRSATSINPSTARTRDMSTAADRNAFLARASTLSTYQPPKRQRLCSDTQDPSPTKEVKQSPFFADAGVQPSPLAQKKARNKKAKRSEFDLWSDDSTDEIFRGLCEVQQVASPAKPSLSRKSLSGEVANDKNEPSEAILQSSPAKEPDSPIGTLIQEPSWESELSEGVQQDDELEPFEDLLESHLRTQRESLMKSFVYQSPSRRDAALRSLSPPVSSVSVPRTFVAQSPERQSAALASLPQIAQVDTVRDMILGRDDTVPLVSTRRSPRSRPSMDTQTSTEKIALARAAIVSKTSGKSVPPSTARQCQNKTKEPTRPQGKSSKSTARPPPILRGSEDALIPNSEDEGSETEESEKPTIDLKAFAFVST